MTLSHMLRFTMCLLALGLLLMSRSSAVAQTASSPPQKKPPVAESRRGAQNPHVTIVPRGTADGEPAPRSVPRQRVKAEILPNRSNNGVVVCSALVAIGLRPLDTQAIQERCALPFTVVPESP